MVCELSGSGSLLNKLLAAEDPAALWESLPELNQPHKQVALLLEPGQSRVIPLQGIERVALGSAAVAGVRVLPGQLLVTARSPGHSSIQIWQTGQEVWTLEIEVRRTAVQGRVLDTQLKSHRGEEWVIKVSLEFIEMSRTLRQALGIHWPDTLHFSSSAALQGATALSGINYTASFSSAQGFVSFLVHQGYAQMVARPDLYVRSGQEAKFHSGGEFPVPNSSQTYGSFLRYIAWKTYGLSVTVCPESEDNVHMSSVIQLEISEPSQRHALDGIPALTRRSLSTKMNSLNGETVLLSGLLRRLSDQSSDKVPWLARIPILGALFFEHDTQYQDATELLMAVTLSVPSQRETEEQLDRTREKALQLWKRPST